MEEKKTYTPEEIIGITINNMSNLCVPAVLAEHGVPLVVLTEQIGIPLMQNINNLKECLRIMGTPKEEVIDLGEINLDEEDQNA